MRLPIVAGAAVAVTAAAAVAVAGPHPHQVTPTGPVPYTSVTDQVAARWGCWTPVTWALNPTGAPAGAAAAAADAFDAYHAATGLTFAYAGTTTAVADAHPSADGPHRPADIVISFDAADPQSAAALLEGGGDAYAATVDATRFRPPFGMWRAAVNRITAADIVVRSQLPDGSLEPLLLHEIGHAVGLGHAGDGADSAMAPHVRTGRTALSTADRVSLADLYGPCPAS